MAIRKLNDDEVRCLRKIFVTWLKKKGYYDDYIEAKMHLKIHYKSSNRDGWPHNLNESKIYYDYKAYSNIVDQTIDYYRCKHIRSDWDDINKEWGNFIDKNYRLIADRFFREKE